MLEQLPLDEVLFLDIETVPQVPSFEDLDEDFQHLWTEKSRFVREKKGLEISESYAEAGVYAEFGKIIVIGVGYFSQSFGERVFRVTSFYGDDETEVLSEFAKLLERFTNNPFRVLCAHNGKEFDFPYLSRRFLINRLPLPAMLDMAGKKPWEIPHLDTLELWKFGDYKHYTSLKLLAKIFGVPTPKDDIDGSMVREVYYKENDLERIERYCRKDVITVAQLMLCYKNQPLVEEDQIIHV